MCNLKIGHINVLKLRYIKSLFSFEMISPQNLLFVLLAILTYFVSKTIAKRLVLTKLKFIRL